MNEQFPAAWLNHVSDALAHIEETERLVNEKQPHYHVVEFINGCLNDYDSGPIEALDEAQAHITGIVQSTDGHSEDGMDVYVEAGEDRYERGIYILKVEECTEDCDPDADY
jgi:hypothetical protein